MAEFDALLRGLKEKGLEVVPLDRLIGREVMRRGGSPGEAHPAALFYDGLAADYDREQFCSPVSIVRKAEYALFEARLPSLFSPSDRVLEIGAGTGIFTLAIARRCREVTAVDISASMLEILEGKAAGEGLGNIRTIVGNAETMDLEWILYGRLRLLLPRIPDGPPGLFLPPRGSHRTGRNPVFHHRPTVPVPSFRADRQRDAAGVVAESPQPEGNRGHPVRFGVRGDPDRLPPLQVLVVRRNPPGSGGPPPHRPGRPGRPLM